MGRRLWAALGAGAFAVAAAALVVRFVPIVNQPLAATAAVVPYLMLGAPVALVVFATLRHWLMAVFAVALTAATVAVQAPLFVADEAPDGVTVRVASANLRYGEADAASVADMARTQADILAVQELTPDAAQRLKAEGLDQDFPFQALRPREGPAGVGIWSRYPIASSSPVDDFWLGFLTARVRTPGSETTVVTTHLSAPWPEPIDGWRNDIARLKEALDRLAARPGPVIVAGDLNSTTDMREFRSLVSDGYRDAADQAGAGFAPTHPADLGIPPVWAVDHVLTRDCTAISVRTLRIEGSDHRALLVNVVLPQP